MGERPFPCIGCLRRLSESERFMISRLAGFEWAAVQSEVGNWCSECATENADKRNHSLQPDQRQASRFLV